MGQTTSNIVKKIVSPITGSRKSDDAADDSVKLAVVPFVFKRRGSLYRDEDGDLAHEFYEEVKDKKTKRCTMRRKYGNLTPQGEVDLQIPRLNADFPIILCEAFPR